MRSWEKIRRLRESARVRDNYSQLDLARDLRVSPKTIRRWEAAGVVKRRDGRITHESLKQLFRKRGSEINFDTLDREMQQWLIDSVGFAPVELRLARDQRIGKHLQRVGVCPGVAAKLVATPMDVISRLAKASAKKAGQAQYDHEDIAKRSRIS